MENSICINLKTSVKLYYRNLQKLVETLIPPKIVLVKLFCKQESGNLLMADQNNSEVMEMSLE